MKKTAQYNISKNVCFSFSASVVSCYYLIMGLLFINLMSDGKIVNSEALANVFFTKTCTILQLKAKATILLVVIICIS